MMSDADAEELRFAFGENWSNFSSTINEDAILEAQQSIRKALGVDDLAGKTFLDAGSGSGLFSLAAHRLGARVHSFDFDPNSVACTTAVRRRYAAHDAQWAVEQGSVLDAAYLARLGQFDVVYSWGVLHHTGSMWDAIGRVAALVRDGGQLVISIYNDQGFVSDVWLRIKRIYNRLPKILRPAFVWLTMLPFELRSALFSVITLRPSRYVHSWTRYRNQRGMNKWHDLVDWVGGLPFEVAKPEAIIFFLRDRGYELTGLTTCGGGIGCNEYVFRLSGR